MGNGELTAAQRAALDHVRARASQQQGAARARILELLRAAHVNQAACDDAIASVRDHARVVIHFHPDRLDVRLRSVADALLEDGVYRNQFDTGLSTGGLLPFVGSARDRWEPVSDAIEAKVGFQPDAFSLSVYDAAWVAILAHIESRGRADLRREAFERNAQRYWGLTGPAALDEAGDRKIADFDIWIVKDTGTKIDWVRR